jgi:ABC-type Mn2+/Zn2+ transport system permease subunit
VTQLLHAAVEPFELGLMQRALLELVVVGAVSGAVGCLVVLRGLSFTGESLAHTVLPGLVLAYALGVSLLLGAAALAAVTVLIALFARHDGRITDDTAMGVAFAGLFPLGVILLAVQEHPTRSLADFLFGDVLANSPSDVRATIALAGLIGVGLWLGYRAALATSFDRAYAATLGYRPQAVDALLLSLVAATVVVSMMTVGNVLALALLVTPAAAARLLVGRMLPMLGLAALLGALAGVAALELSYWAGLAASATVVLCAAAEFVLCLAVAGTRGLVASRT